MQSAGDTDLAAAVADPLRRPDTLAAADWNGDGGFSHAESDLGGLVESWGVERALVSDLPAEVSLVDGFVTSKLTMKLKGARRGWTTLRNVAQLFSPLRSDSPLYRRPTVGRLLRLDAGFRTRVGRKTVRQFTGPISKINPQADGSVEIEALDWSEGLRGPVSLPVYAPWLDLKRVEGNAFAINTQWVIDYVLRRFGRSASPTPRADAIIAVSGHGGAVNELGPSYPVGGAFFETVEARRPGQAWAPGGPWGLLCAGGYGVYRSITIRHAAKPPAGRARYLEWGTGLGFSARIWCGSGANYGNSGDDNWLFSLLGRTDAYNLYGSNYQGLYCGIFGDGRLRIWAIGRDGSTAPLIISPGPVGWRFVGIHFQMRPNGDLICTYRINGTTTTRTLAGPWYVSLGATSQLLAHTYFTAYWSDFEVWDSYAPPAAGAWPNEEWTPKASLGRGLNHLTCLPNIVGRDGFEVICEAVGAEYGVVGFDESGWFDFRARTALPQSDSTVVKELPAESALIDYALPIDISTVRNVVTGTTTRTMWRRVFETVYAADDLEEWTFDQGTSYLTVDIPNRVLMPERETIPGGRINDWNDPPRGFRAVIAGTENEAPNVSVSAILSAPRQLTVEVINNSGQRVTFAAKPQAAEPVVPAFRVAGYNLVDLPEATLEHEVPASIARYGRRVLPLEANPWRQILDPMVAVARTLTDEIGEAVPTLADVPIVGDPRLQLSDTVRLRDARGLAPSIVGRLVKINREGSRGGPLAEKVSVRPFAATWPYPT